MTPLRVDQVMDILPDLDELGPILSRMLATSHPDPARTWTASGEVATVGDRIVDVARLESSVSDLADDVRDRLIRTFDAICGMSRALEEGRDGDAARILVDMAEAEEERSRFARALSYSEAAWRIARGFRDQRLAARTLRRMGRYQRGLGRLREAETRYARAFEIAEATGDVQGAAEAGNGVALTFMDRGRWNECIAWSDRVLALLSADGELIPERWHACLNRHIALRSDGALEESRDWFQRAETLAHDLEDSGARPYLANARGQLHMATGAFEEAERALRRALEEEASPHARVVISLNLAETLLAGGRSMEAAEVVREAEALALTADAIPKLPEIYRLLARIQHARGLNDAFVLFERALEIVRNHDLPDFELAQTLQAYGEAERARGEEQAADELRSRARALYDRLGIQGGRRRWADLFDAPRESQAESGTRTTEG